MKTFMMSKLKESFPHATRYKGSEEKEKQYVAAIINIKRRRKRLSTQNAKRRKQHNLERDNRPKVSQTEKKNHYC